jgi:hypothetical protein
VACVDLLLLHRHRKNGLVEVGAATLFNGGGCEAVNRFGHRRSCSIFALRMKRDEPRHSGGDGGG